jgi:hypothetical protein
LTLEQVQDHRFEIGVLDIDLSPGATITPEVVDDKLYILIVLIVVIRDDRWRPIGRTH